MSAPNYVIELKGTLGQRFARCFDGLEMACTDGRTVLSGKLDQSQLHGVLNRVNERGIELLSVERRHAASVDSSREGGPR